MGDALTARQVARHLLDTADVDAPVLVQLGLHGAEFLPIRAHGSFDNGDCRLHLARSLPILVTAGGPADPGGPLWPARRAGMLAALAALGEFTPGADR